VSFHAAPDALRLSIRDISKGKLTLISRVPDIIAASIAISVFGFFSGPLFAAVSR